MSPVGKPEPIREPDGSYWHPDEDDGPLAGHPGKQVADRVMRKMANQRQALVDQAVDIMTRGIDMYVEPPMDQQDAEQILKRVGEHCMAAYGKIREENTR